MYLFKHNISFNEATDMKQNDFLLNYKHYTLNQSPKHR